MNRKCCNTPKGPGPHADDCINNPAKQGVHTVQKMPDGSLRRGRKETADAEPDYTRSCIVCGASPVLPATGMCGPCTFGEADTIDGNW